MLMQKFQRVLMVLTIASAGVIVGANCTTSNVAHGETQPSPMSPPFLKGDQLALPVLKDIATTLRQMDSRLARLESVAQRLQMQSSRHEVGTSRDLQEPMVEEPSAEPADQTDTQ